MSRAKVEADTSPEGNLFDSEQHGIEPNQKYILDTFPEIRDWGVPHKDKPDLILPPAVCENGQHTGNPHCDIVVPDLPSPVPLPAAMWLFAAAVGALVCVARRGKNNGGDQ